ncbi:hypothetical protein [Peptostreptococcus sp. D1]|uniref:hypothetical protein n=1 Tax=Peptostreptococcus sp. D1 TaxID=72304 RepID=UPI0008ECEFD9|nr:hypothetical protein [Peptostreptococcus sp. D1]SFE17433.1 hypothetical protein SAMN02910278_00128 [Peptostreptococcus sp. D1]
MLFIEFDLNTRYKIYAQTKKVLRKYQKGIISGKLTSEQFVRYMMNDFSFKKILSENQISVCDFEECYKSYVETLIGIQNESLLNNKGKYTEYYSNKAPCSSIFKLKSELENHGYVLEIPTQYLTEWDIDCIVKYINTGVIDIGNEKIYNYVTKI